MRKTLIFVLLLALPLTGTARRAVFSSGRLASIAQAAGLYLPGDPAGNSLLFSVVCQGRNVPVVVEYGYGEVTHIGLDIFGEEMKGDKPLVYDFVERHMLETLLGSGSGDWDSEPMYGRVVVKGDIFRVLQMKRESRTVSLAVGDDGEGHVEIATESGYPVFSIRFPSEVQLLTGARKDELEKAFIRKVAVERKVGKREIPRILKRTQRDLYVSENGFFGIEAAQNTAFFRRKAFSYVPVCESSLPKESVMTILSGYGRGKDYSVQMKIHQYGFNDREINIPLDYLIDFCLNEGCAPYVGIESESGGTVVATLFMVNHSLAYCHTVRFTLDTDILDHTAGILYARAHLYTPLNPKKL